MAVHYSGKAHLSGKISHGPRAAYDIDALSLFSAMTEAPDAIRKGVINNVIVDLKGAGIWSKLDGLWMLAAHAEQAGLLNWITRTEATAIGSPTFAADDGFTGGTGKAINTRIVPSTSGIINSNSISFGAYSRTDANEVGAICGCRTSSSAGQNIIQPRSSGSAVFRVNIATVTTSVTVANSLGFYAANRSGASALECYKNGSAIGSNTTAASPQPAFAFYLLAYNGAGTVRDETTRQIAAGFIGSSMSATEHSDLYTIVQNYMTAVGANV